MRPQSAESVTMPMLWRAYAMWYANALVRMCPRGLPMERAAVALAASGDQVSPGKSTKK